MSASTAKNRVIPVCKAGITTTEPRPIASPDTYASSPNNARGVFTSEVSNMANSVESLTLYLVSEVATENLGQQLVYEPLTKERREQLMKLRKLLQDAEGGFDDDLGKHVKEAGGGKNSV